MSTAKEMFEKLEYKLDEKMTTTDMLSYKKCKDSRYIVTIRFFMEDKTYSVDVFDTVKNTSTNRVQLIPIIPIESHQAIHKQLIELGWII